MIRGSINEAISNLEAAYDGASVKQALVDLAETLNVLGGADTELLGGHGPKYYVLVSEINKIEKKLDTWLKYDVVPTVDSPKVIKNKDITTYFGSFLETLKQVNGDRNNHYDDDDPELHIGHDIDEALNFLAGTFAEIKTQINNKATGEESTIHDTDSIEVYAEKLSNIILSVLDVKPYTVTEDNDYKDEDIIRDREGNIISGKAWNPVTVAIKLKGQDYTATTTGSQKPSTGYDGFSSITIKIDESGSGSSSGSGGSGGSSGSGSDEEGELNLTNLQVTENGDYAKPANFDGYSEVDVRVTEFDLPEDKELTVTFVTRHMGSDEVEELVKIPVRVGENAKYPNSVPQYQTNTVNYPDEGYIFDRWIPAPFRVVDDMTCEAHYEKWLRHKHAYTPGNDKINDMEFAYCDADWIDIIAKNVNAHNLVKQLRLKDGREVRLICTSNDIWYSLDPVPIDTIGNYEKYDTSAILYTNWPDNPLRSYLNNEFITDILPDWIVSHIDDSTTSNWSVAPKVDRSSSFDMVSDNYPRLDYIYYDNTSGIYTTYYKKGNSDSRDIFVGNQFVSSDDRIWIPSVFDFALIPIGMSGDFTDDIFSCSDLVMGTEHYNTYDSAGRKKDVDYPSSIQIGPWYKPTKMYMDKIKCQFNLNYANLSTLQSSYSPVLKPKSAQPYNVYNEIVPGVTIVPNKYTLLRNGNITATQASSRQLYTLKSEFITNPATVNVLFRDRFINTCSITGETLVQEVDPVHNGIYYRYNDSGIDLSYTAYLCGMNAYGCFLKRPSLDGIHICFKLKE